MSNGTKYPKIDTLWKRDENNKFRIIEGDCSKDEFNSIREWDITEKVDGTNIRIIYENGTVTFGGRTDDAQIPAALFKHMQEKFTDEVMGKLFDSKTVLYGEGYGARIQKGGGLYRNDVSFVLFDVLIGEWWLLRESVEDIAFKLGIPRVEVIGTMTTDDAVEYVKSRPNSIIADQPKVMEGIVARSHPPMLFRDGTPIMWKLKVKDYR